jgi:hypothetical protein
MGTVLSFDFFDSEHFWDFIESKDSHDDIFAFLLIFQMFLSTNFRTHILTNKEEKSTISKPAALRWEFDKENSVSPDTISMFTNLKR